MKRGKKSGNAKSIPHEIVYDILTRLPVKSLSRFRCVSKLWNSTISDRRFVNSHHTRSLTRPHGTTLLLTFSDRSNFQNLLFSADHHQEDPVAIHHLTRSGFAASYVSESLNGFICLGVSKNLRVCNPSTRDFITLPPIKPETFSSYFVCFNKTSFGFDPVNNQHKVLNTWVIGTADPNKEMLTEHRIFTLGANSWRIIGDGQSHYPQGDGVCIDGTIFYRGCASLENPKESEVMVAFDVRVETFRFIQLPNDALLLHEFDSALIRYHGCLAIVDYQHLRDGISMDLWVLEDSHKQVWAKKSIVLPPYWIHIREDQNFFLAGTTHTGEMILASHKFKKPFYVFYVDTKTNNVRRVEIHVLPVYESHFQEASTDIHISVSDHAESILSLSDLN